MTSHEYITEITGKMCPELRYDFKEDFSIWQFRARTKLNELLGLPLQKPKEDHFNISERIMREELEIIRFSFQSEEGYTVPCTLMRKVSLPNGAPLVICLQGHSTGMHISLGEIKHTSDSQCIAGGRDFAVRAAREGMVAIAVEQRYMGTRGSNNGEPSCVPNNNFTHSNEAMSALLIGRTAIGERVWDVQRVIDVAEEHFKKIIDFSNIVCLGNSGGGTVTFYAACLDERIKLAVPSCSVCTFEKSIMAMNHCPCNFIPNIRKYFDMSDLCCLAIPRKMLIVCGREDEIFPLDGVLQTYEAARKVYEYNKNVKNIRLIIGSGGHQFYPDEAWPVIHMLLNIK